MTNEEMRETKIDSTEYLDGKVMKVTVDRVTLPNGGESFREVAWHRGAVCVIPVTDSGDVVLVEQFRYPYDQVLLEIPAGKLEKGEDDRSAAALRELSEETGYNAGKLICLGDYYGSPAILRERITMFLATELTEGEVHPDDDEFLRVRKIPLSTAVDLVMKGDIPDGKTQVAILKAANMFKA